MSYPITKSLILNAIKVRDICGVIDEYLLDKKVGPIESGIFECGIEDYSLYEWGDVPINEIKIENHVRLIIVSLKKDRYDDFVYLVDIYVNENYPHKLNSNIDENASNVISCVMRTKGEKYVKYIKYIYDRATRMGIDEFLYVTHVNYNPHVTKYFMSVYPDIEDYDKFAYSVNSLLEIQNLGGEAKSMYDFYIGTFVENFMCLESYDSNVDEYPEDYKGVHDAFVYCLKKYKTKLEKYIHYQCYHTFDRYYATSIEIYNTIREVYEIKVFLEPYYKIPETRRINNRNEYMAICKKDIYENEKNYVSYVVDVLLKCYDNGNNYEEAYDLVDNIHIFSKEMSICVYDLMKCLLSPEFMTVLSRRIDWYKILGSHIPVNYLCPEAKEYLMNIGYKDRTNYLKWIGDICVHPS